MAGVGPLTPEEVSEASEESDTPSLPWDDAERPSVSPQSVPTESNHDTNVSNASESADRPDASVDETHSMIRDGTETLSAKNGGLKQFQIAVGAIRAIGRMRRRPSEVYAPMSPNSSSSSEDSSEHGEAIMTPVNIVRRNAFVPTVENISALKKRLDDEVRGARIVTQELGEELQRQKALAEEITSSCVQALRGEVDLHGKMLQMAAKIRTNDERIQTQLNNLHQLHDEQRQWNNRTALEQSNLRHSVEHSIENEIRMTRWELQHVKSSIDSLYDLRSKVDESHANRSHRDEPREIDDAAALRSLPSSPLKELVNRQPSPSTLKPSQPPEYQSGNSQEVFHTLRRRSESMSPSTPKPSQSPEHQSGNSQEVFHTLRRRSESIGGLALEIDRPENPEMVASSESQDAPCTTNDVGDPELEPQEEQPTVHRRVVEGSGTWVNESSAVMQALDVPNELGKLQASYKNFETELDHSIHLHEVASKEIALLQDLIGGYQTKTIAVQRSHSEGLTALSATVERLSARVDWSINHLSGVTEILQGLRHSLHR